MKKQKLNIQNSIASLRDGLEQETLNADVNKDLSCVARAAAFVRSLKEKENVLKSLKGKEKKLLEDYKKL